MSQEKLNKIKQLKRKSSEEALKALNEATGLTWEKMPTSLVNQTKK